MVPRGRDRNFDTHINGNTSIAHIVLMHTQNRYGGNEHREIASPNITTVGLRVGPTAHAMLHGIN